MTDTKLTEAEIESVLSPYRREGLHDARAPTEIRQLQAERDERVRYAANADVRIANDARTIEAQAAEIARLTAERDEAKGVADIAMLKAGEAMEERDAARKWARCPFDDGDFKLDVNVPCPVCGDLGTIPDEDAPSACPTDHWRVLGHE